LTTVHHTIARVDDYAWLRAVNWRAVMRDPSLLDHSIKAHLEAENAYAKGVSPTPKSYKPGSLPR
jgi:oligopeptidase B